MTGPEAALAGCRFARNGAAALLWGAFADLSALVPPVLANEVGGRLRTVRLVAIAVVIVASAAMLPAEVASIGSGWSDALDPGLTGEILRETSAGRAWLAEAGAALLLAATLLAPVGRQRGATALAAGLVLASLALTGHAAMHEGALDLAHRFNDVVHVLAGGAWVGALVPTLPILRALEQPGRRHEAAIALRRFSTAGHVAVVLVVATGALNTALVLGRWPTDWASPYQALLSAKIALVALMVAIALVHRYGLVPRLSRHPGPVLPLLRWGTRVEIALGFLVLGCVAVFGLFDPA